MLLAAVLLPVLAPRAAGVAALGTASADVTQSATIARSAVPQVITRPAQTIVVSPGQTLQTIAQTYRTDVATLRWANDVTDGHQPQAGAILVVPPGAGALVALTPGERPSHLAARLGIDPRVILDYNQLHRDTPLPAGTFLQIPAALAGPGALAAADVVPVAPRVPGVPADQASRGNIYPYGQCTWYVASRRNVTWKGDAWAWLSSARGIRHEGHVPVAGAIVVMDQGWSGHVALVDSVNADGSYVISEMNYYGDGGGWGRVDQRTLAPGEPWVMGFIY